MIPLLADAGWYSIASILTAFIAIVPATLAAIWSRKSKSNTASVLEEVRTNGGMGDPNPNINDHIKYQTQMMEKIVDKVSDVDDRLNDHLDHSKVMDKALAEVYLTVMQQQEERDNKD
jgi:hypothetical protein